MISAAEVQNGVAGAWRLMFGRREGLALLDLTADGFWNSFYAMVLALPPLLVIWTLSALDVDTTIAGGRPGILLRLAIIDFAAWVAPLIVLALVAKPLGIGDRFVHYVVASNWASAIIIWLLLPPVLAGNITGPSDVVDLLTLLVFLSTLILTWRMTNAALEKGVAMGTGVFVLMIVLSIIVVYGLEYLLGMPQSVRAT